MTWNVFVWIRNYCGIGQENRQENRKVFEEKQPERCMSVSAIVAGSCGALASVFSKLTFGSGQISTLQWTCSISALIVFNICMWIFHTRALKNSANTLRPCLLNNVANFVLSGIFGCILFGELAVYNLTWWLGLTLIFAGTALVLVE